MEEEIESALNLKPDSISWGSAANDAVRKVYGNSSKGAFQMAMKIEIQNVLKEFALREIKREEMKHLIEDIKKYYEEGDINEM